MYASYLMMETERQYTKIEKESLTTSWLSKKLSTYILGKSFLIETDHEPLVPLLGTKCLDNMSPRILQFYLQLARFDFMPALQFGGQRFSLSSTT